MAFNYTSSSHNFVPEYQQSGIPHLETKTLAAPTDTATLTTNINNYRVQFNHVTRWIEIHNHGTNSNNEHLRLYFSETAAKKAFEGTPDNHYYLIDSESSTRRLEIKCKEVWLIPDVAGNSFKVSIIAGLTSVPKNNFPDQTYNNGFNGVEDNPNP